MIPRIKPFQRIFSTASQILGRSNFPSLVLQTAPTIGQRHFHSQNSQSSSRQRNRYAIGGAAVAIMSGLGVISLAWNNQPEKTLDKTSDKTWKPLKLDQVDKWSSVIVGGGTAGCVTAYMLAKWMEDNDIPGDVLLLERGGSYEEANPGLSAWYHNWGQLGKAHDAVLVVRDESGKVVKTLPYSVVPTEHKGLGGCGAHDTRIFFEPNEEERQRYADALGMSVEQFSVYLQAALNLEPTIPAAGVGEPYFDRVAETLVAKAGFPPLKDNYFEGRVQPGVGYVAVGAYENGNQEALRWTSAFLVAGINKPKNLHVLTGAEAERILFQPDTQRSLMQRFVDGLKGFQPLRAAGVVVQQGDDKFRVDLEPHGHITVAAGALSTPAILQRSGVGDPDVLQKAGVALTINSPEVGHGVDHEEVAVVYDAPPVWPNNEVPKGGVMGWPVVIFTKLEELNKLIQAHFSISGPPYSDGITVVGTPNNSQPDLTAGYRVSIQSPNVQTSSLCLSYEQSEVDKKVLLAGVRKMILLFDILQKEKLVGERLEPPTSGSLAVDIHDDESLLNWLRLNTGTAFHWLCTCKAGIDELVANEDFKLRHGTGSGVIDNLYVGSGASLPFPPHGNPHVPIQTFAIIQAYKTFEALCRANGREVPEPKELVIARKNFAEGGLQLRQPGQEKPPMQSEAEAYKKVWKQV